MKWPKRLVVPGTLVAIALVGTATWVFAQTDGAIHACYNDKSGSIRIVGPEDVCRESEARLVWNIVGPPGEDGKDGTSCSVVQGDGEATIQCTDGTSATVSDGAPGPPGPPADLTDLEERVAYLECELFGESCPYRLVFVSSEATYGHITEEGPSGTINPRIASANAICQRLAEEAGFVPYGKVFKAWLSVGLRWEPGLSTPATSFVQSDVPYVRVDGVKVADNWADLVDGNLAAPINVDEQGVGDYTVSVWTGTYSDGSIPASDGDLGRTVNCSDWSYGPYPDDSFGLVGQSWQTDARWTDAQAQLCSSEAHIYCFQQ